MPTPNEIYEALEARRLELGLSQADVGARAFGKPDNSAFQALRRGSSPSAEKLAALCAAVGWEFYFGPARETGPVESVALGGESFAQIPLHAASLSAGHGHENHQEAVIDYLAFRRDWLRRVGVSPSSAVLARADGNSMQPTIWAGDLVLIDRTRADLPVRKTETKARRSSIYAFVEDGHARIKRIERPAEGELLLLSDNPDYGPQFARASDITVIGKVMWWGHTNRD